MKSLFKRFVLITGITVLAVSCGGSKGGGGNNGAAYSTLSSANLSATGAQALAEANAWYASTVEGTSIVVGNVGNVVKTKYVSNSQANCVQKTFLGIPYQWCTSSSNSNQAGTVLSTVQVNINSTVGLVISGKGNVDLNNIFAGAAGTLLGGNVQGAVIQLDFLRADGVVVSYWIDRNHHSLLNPAQVTENLSTGRNDVITTYQRVY